MIHSAKKSPINLLATDYRGLRHYNASLGSSIVILEQELEQLVNDACDEVRDDFFDELFNELAKFRTAKVEPIQRRVLKKFSQWLIIAPSIEEYFHIVVTKQKPPKRSVGADLRGLRYISAVAVQSLSLKMSLNQSYIERLMMLSTILLRTSRINFHTVITPLPVIKAVGSDNDRRIVQRGTKIFN